MKLRHHKTRFYARFWVRNMGTPHAAIWTGSPHGKLITRFAYAQRGRMPRHWQYVERWGW